MDNHEEVEGDEYSGSGSTVSVMGRINWKLAGHPIYPNTAKTESVQSGVDGNILYMIIQIALNGGLVVFEHLKQMTNYHQCPFWKN